MQKGILPVPSNHVYDVVGIAHVSAHETVGVQAREERFGVPRVVGTEM